jgi:hypothetical protein
MSDALENPFKKYEQKLEIVNTYYKIRGWENKRKTFYKGKRSYGKLAAEAKELYEVLGRNLEDCIWAIDKMNYLATKGGFEWSISTCLKHKKL